MKYFIPSQKLMSVFDTWMKINYPNYFDLERTEQEGRVFVPKRILFRNPEGVTIFIWYYKDHFDRLAVLNLDDTFFNDVLSTFSDYGPELIKKWFKKEYRLTVQKFFHISDE